MYLVRQKILKINLTLILVFLLACEENEQVQDEYVAKVGNIILTEEGLENYLSQDKYSKKFKNEFIRQWIDEELLYQEAGEQDLTSSEEYLQLIETAQKQLAASLMVEKYFSDNFSEPADNRLNMFYESEKENFRLTDKVYVINIFEFNNETSALEFRNMSLLKNWAQASQVFEKDSGFVSKSDLAFFYNYELSPLHLSRIVRELNPNEISLIINKEPSIFTVVQMVKTIDKGEVADFSLVKNEVKEIYYSEKRKELFRKYLDQLYSKYRVELKRVDE